MTNATERQMALYRFVVEARMAGTVEAIDGGLVIDWRGQRVLLLATDGDPERVCLTVSVEHEGTSMPQLLLAAQRVSRDQALAKVLVLSETVYAVVVESVIAGPDLLPTPETVGAVLPRLASAVLAGTARMREELLLIDAFDAA